MNVNRLQAPFPWFGGKRKVADIVWRRFGDVANYVEPFYGSGAVLLGRPQPFKGIETINDADGYVANFWRAVKHNPDETAFWADNPVNENDLHARHYWLVQRKDELVPQLEGDPSFYDSKVAGWWVWGICTWIGSGFCSGDGSWFVDDGMLRKLPHLGNKGRGIQRQLPHLGNKGLGIQRQLPHLGDKGRGIQRQLPHLGNGQGIQRKLPHLGDKGRGIQRQLPHLGNGQGIQRKLPHLGDKGRGILDWFVVLAKRLELVRVCCGDWTRVCGPSVTFKHGITGVFLDPPYGEETNRCMNLYRVDSGSIPEQVQLYCQENGSSRDMRMAVCGYENEYDLPGWDVYDWNAGEGFGGQAVSRTKNGKRERIWFSPACLKGGQQDLFG